MIEPAASLRLQRVRDAYESSLLSPRPRGSTSAPLLLRRAADARPAALASSDASDLVAGDGAGSPPAAPTPPLADGYVGFRERAFGAESVSAAFLATIAAQAEALALVWEAHARGAVTLPPGVAAAVSAARSAAR